MPFGTSVLRVTSGQNGTRSADNPKNTATRSTAELKSQEQQLERKRRPQFEFPWCRRRSVRPACDRIGLAKERRTKIAHERSEIDVVEHVPCIDAEGQAIAPARRAAQADGSAHAAESAATTHSWASRSPSTPAATATPGTSTPGSAHAAAGRQVTALGFWTKPDCLAQPQVQRKPSRAHPIIRRNHCLSRQWRQVERTPLGDHEVLRRQSRRRECRTVIENRVAVIVLSQGDVEGNSRGYHQKRIQPEASRQCHRSTNKRTIAYVVHGGPLVFRQVVLVIGKGVRPVSVGLDVVQ